MIPILTHLEALLSQYDTLICDVWGVLHNGIRAFPDANDTLMRFRQKGGNVVLLSNSPGTSDNVTPLLISKGVKREAWDVMVTSGDLTRWEILRRKLTHVHHIGTQRDVPTFDGLNITRVDLDDAQALVVTGLFDDENETANDYKPLLAQALTRRLPLICANPDLIVHVGAQLYPCAGAIAELYETMGGEVYWAGKPHKPAYDAAFAQAHVLRNNPHQKILAIGDALRTDITGAQRAGLHSLLITQGIHRDDLHGDASPHSAIRQDILNKICEPFSNTLVGAADALRW